MKNLMLLIAIAFLFTGCGDGNEPKPDDDSGDDDDFIDDLLDDDDEDCEENSKTFRVCEVEITFNFCGDEGKEVFFKNAYDTPVIVRITNTDGIPIVENCLWSPEFGIFGEDTEKATYDRDTIVAIAVYYGDDGLIDYACRDIIYDTDTFELCEEISDVSLE